jgi:hypothetical protein
VVEAFRFSTWYDRWRHFSLAFWSTRSLRTCSDAVRGCKKRGGQHREEEIEEEKTYGPSRLHRRALQFAKDVAARDNGDRNGKKVGEERTRRTVMSKETQSTIRLVTPYC